MHVEFDHHLNFDPANDLEQFLKLVPAKWVVYLMSDADDRPIQLLCVKNLRASLKRRLGGEETVGPTRRVKYPEIVRRIHWRRVDSAFEADWLYYETARQLFPASYQGMVGFRPAWFIHVNPEAEFPRYTKTIQLAARRGIYIGPLEDKHAAARLIELIEDAFDLCRYYHILIQAPNASACAYKEMGKCPAPCDGSISMAQYRLLIDLSVSTLRDPAGFLEDQKQRMEQAAGELRFELAAKIKAYVDELSALGKGAFRHAGELDDFRFVCVQRGPRAATAKVFLIVGGAIEESLGLIAQPQDAVDLMPVLLGRLPAASVADENTERIGVVAQHLFAAKATQGVFIRLSQAHTSSLAKAWADLKKQKPTEEATDEGVMRELQAI